jgi:hypothetical protein
VNPDDVSLGDLGRMRALLDAAARAGHIPSDVRFWVTEFSWDSRPADPQGLPPTLHARWVAEALYRMWDEGVSLVTWFLIRDEPFPQGMFQSGLYFRGKAGIESDRPKPALRAFRFPFVTFREPGRIFFWGRTPAGMPGRVIVEVHRGTGWRRVAAPHTDRHGIFSGRIASVVQIGSLRARLANGSDSSVPFGLRVPPDRRFCPWGSFCTGPS